VSYPVENHFCRWAEVPCVKVSGSTRPWALFWMRSSPTEPAASRASAMSVLVKGLLKNPVCTACLGELLLPVLLNAVDHADDAAVLRLVGVGARTALRRQVPRGRGAATTAADDVTRVDPEDQCGDQADQADRATAEGHAAERQPPSAP
jgi:hypothetical protein